MSNANVNHQDLQKKVDQVVESLTPKLERLTSDELLKEIKIEEDNYFKAKIEDILDNLSALNSILN